MPAQAQGGGQLKPVLYRDREGTELKLARRACYTAACDVRNLQLETLTMNPPAPRRLLILLCLTGCWPVSACSQRTTGQSAAVTRESALPTTALNVEPVRPEAVQAVFERNCKLCHGPDGHGIAAIAPDVRRAPQRSAEAWEKYLRNPKSLYPNSQMPPLEGRSDEEIKAIAAYLADLTQHNPLPKEAEAKR